ncbi:osteopetrosis-associated transmembrane protein 1 isoform X2 [Periplaneta americana]|uniref:osteopetrosis-associated transmembrane protein 1 isoform X2 n=1 Tax=Periplaneta americana TaxID=6978 RepID=UPI0037E6FE4E
MNLTSDTKKAPLTRQLGQEITRFNDEEMMSNGHTCNKYLQQFANSTSEFTKCAIRHARPIRICEKCIYYYLDVQKSYEEILKARDEGGHACMMELVNLDRLEVIDGALDYVYKLWGKAECNCCFVVEDNGTLTSQLSNVTIKFQQLYNNTTKCFEKFYNPSTEKYDPKICVNCTTEYCTLNKFYEDLKADTGEGIVCMDIVDAMNLTRTKWSKRFGCYVSIPKAEITLIISVVVIALSPVVFYVGSKYATSRAEKRIPSQRRISADTSIPSTSSS